KATRYAHTDVTTQLIASAVPHLAKSYYAALAGAQLNPANPRLKAVYALRSRAALFGATAAKLPRYVTRSESRIKELPAGTLKAQTAWGEWWYATDESGQNAFLDGANEAITAGSYAICEVGGHRQVLRIKAAATSPRSAYGLTGQTTALTFELPDDSPWRSVDHIDLRSKEPARNEITELRQTKLYVQSEALTLVDEPIDENIDTSFIELDGLYKELTSGRWVIVSGERADIEQVRGVRVAELQMISGLSHGYNPDLPNDTAHTTLTLATDLAYTYKRDTLKIYGNVVKATQGSTRREILGSGDGAQVFQSFTLKQPPITFVAAPTAEGAQSTLHVYADNVEWHESSSLALLDPKTQGFITQTDDEDATRVLFGDGKHGARLPSGVQNITAMYRSGIGAGGNVEAEQITTLQSRPLGVTAVINPLRASGGADKEGRDLGRENAPLSVMPLDRLVSVQDYEDFARRFAGIAKALARRDTDGNRSVVYLTIAGVDDVPIDVTSDLYRNLLEAFTALGDPDLPLRVDLRERKALVLSANIKILPDHRWEIVVSAVRTALLDAFGFDKRKLGQKALLSDVISVMQRVRGVAWVDIDAFGAVPEKNKKTRELSTPDEIVKAIEAIIDSSSSVDQMPSDIDAWPGGFDAEIPMLRPAEIIAFTPAVPDTLILNQIL
ncbi:MAG: putative baseplate assembly protein, partial [Pseudomonadales bacterium]|nr:putative baseplate assembly protein [Pseudomonadales bacterium]